jgi:hypothetical protein
VNEPLTAVELLERHFDQVHEGLLPEGSPHDLVLPGDDEGPNPSVPGQEMAYLRWVVARFNCARAAGLRPQIRYSVATVDLR